MGEVELDSTNFASADGVYNDFKESVNAAIKAIYQEEDMEWPFGWHNTTFVTTIGENSYTKLANALALDWDSFKIKRNPISIYTITQVGGVATVTTLVDHQLITGDNIYMGGADQTDYVGNFSVTVLSTTQFTISVATTAVTPATGTIFFYPVYQTKKLRQIDYDAYREERWETDDDNLLHPGQYSLPNKAVRKPDNNFLISPRPDRKYTVSYDYFSIEDDLVLYSDVPGIPEPFKQVIVDGAIYHAYMFRDNIEEAADAKDKFDKGVNSMRRILIPQQYFMRIVN